MYILHLALKKPSDCYSLYYFLREVRTLGNGDDDGGGGGGDGGQAEKRSIKSLFRQALS